MKNENEKLAMFIFFCILTSKSGSHILRMVKEAAIVHSEGVRLKFKRNNMEIIWKTIKHTLSLEGTVIPQVLLNFGNQIM